MAGRKGRRGARRGGGSEGGQRVSERYPFARFRGLAISVFGWSEEEFWRSTPMAVLDGLREYRRIHCSGSDVEKRRRFAKFKDGVETADNERRWQRERRAAKRAKRPGSKGLGAKPRRQ